MSKKQKKPRPITEREIKRMASRSQLLQRPTRGVKVTTKRGSYRRKT